MKNKENIQAVMKKLENIDKEDLKKKLENEYDLALKYVGNQKFNKTNIKDNHRVALLFYDRILEYTYGLIENFKKENLESIAMPLFRGFLEAYVDLVNIIHIEGYLLYIVYLDILEEIKLEKSFKKHKMISQDDIDKKNLKSESEKILSELKKDYSSIYFVKNKKGKYDLKKKKSFKFELANLEEVYEFMYWELCSDSHNSITSLRKYIKNNDINNIIFFQEMSDNDTKKILITLFDMFKNSREIMNSILKIKE